MLHIRTWPVAKSMNLHLNPRECGTTGCCSDKLATWLPAGTTRLQISGPSASQFWSWRMGTRPLPGIRP